MSNWRILGNEKQTARGSAVLCECYCGAMQFVNFYDLKSGHSKSCKKCAGQNRVSNDKKQDIEAFLERCRKGGAVRAATSKSKYTAEELYISRLLSNAKKRCNDPTSKNYGARGIKFLFISVEEGTRYLFQTIGPRPSDKYSLDRIDNNAHYEKGNLRWATDSEQVRNRRRKPPSPRKIRLLRLMALRPDYSLEGIDTLIKKGLTDAEIMKRKKVGGRPRKDA